MLFVKDQKCIKKRPRRRKNKFMDKKKRTIIIANKSKKIVNINKLKIENWLELLDKSLNEIYIFDKETLLFEYVNFGAQKNLGYSQEQLLKMTPLDIKPEFTLTSFHSLIRPLVGHKKKVLVFQTVHKRADGTLYPIEVHLQLFKQDEGMKFLAFVLDIAERKNVEEELRESESNASFNIQHMPVGMIQWDKSFQVVRWNPAAEKIFGYTEKGAMGKHARFIIPEEVQPHVDEIWRHLLAGEINQSINDNITKDGRRITCDWHNAPLKTLDGKVYGVVSMMLDVTEQKKREKELSDKALESEKITHIMVDRELRMVELKKTIKELESKLIKAKK